MENCSSNVLYNTSALVKTLQLGKLLFSIECHKKYELDSHEDTKSTLHESVHSLKRRILICKNNIRVQNNIYVHLPDICLFLWLLPGGICRNRLWKNRKR